MSGLSNIIIFVYVSMVLFPGSECQVTLTNINGTGNFLCGYSTRLECAIPGYAGRMSWKSNGTIIARCVFVGNCTAPGALPSGEIFSYNVSAGKFYLDIGITYADNGTLYQCNDVSTQDQTTVNIQVPPSESAFITTITETATSITVEAGCFYPSNAGRMDVYCVSDNDTEEKIHVSLTMKPTTTGCTGNCSGPNIYTATRNITIDSSYTGGNSTYRFKVYHKDFKQYAISSDSSAIYKCGNTTTVSTTKEHTTLTSRNTGHSTSLPPTTTSSNTSAQPGSACGTSFTIIIAVCCVVGLFAFI